MDKTCRKCGASVLTDSEYCSFCLRNAVPGSGIKCTRCNKPMKVSDKGPICGNCMYVADVAVGRLCVRCGAPVAASNTSYCHLCADKPAKPRNHVASFGRMLTMLIFVGIACGATYMGYQNCVASTGDPSSFRQAFGYAMIFLSFLCWWQVWRSFRSL